MHYILIITISSTKTIELKRLIDTPAASELAPKLIIILNIILLKFLVIYIL